MPEESSKNHVSIVYLGAAILVAAVLSAGITYAALSHQNSNTQDDLQAQINSLKSQVAVLPTATPIATATPLATATPTPTASATATTVSTCAAGNLKASLVAASGGGTAGHYYYDVVLTNTGTTSCTVSGGPTISALNSTGTEVGRSVAASTSTTAVTLAANAKAYSLLSFVNSGNLDASACKAMTSLVVYLPGKTTGSTISAVDKINATYTGEYCQDLAPTAFTTTAQ